MRYIDKSTRCIVFDDFLAQYGQRLHGDWEKLKKITEKPKNGERIAVGRNAYINLFAHLHNEQKGLCVYCEQEIPAKTTENDASQGRAHIEHVQTQKELKAQNKRTLVFEQSNLALSCNGFDCTVEEIEDNMPIKEFCAHFKDGNYNPTQLDDNLFLNPLWEINIEAYFDYELQEEYKQVVIVPNTECTTKQQQKADFTIKFLGLQHPTLCEMRYTTYWILMNR